CNRALTRRRQPLRRLEKHRDSLLNFETDQTGGGEDGGVHAALLDLAQSRRHVAPQLNYLEIGPARHQLGPSSQTRSAHSRSGRQIIEPFRPDVAVDHEHITWILAL